MIKFPEFNGEAERFAPIYVKDRWNVVDDKIIYIFYEVSGYRHNGELFSVYVMKEPGDWYSIGNDSHEDDYFQDNAQNTFEVISKDEFYKEFNNALNNLKMKEYNSLIDLDQPLPIYAKVITPFQHGDFVEYYKIYEVDKSLENVTCAHCSKYALTTKAITEVFNKEPEDNQKFIQVTKEEYEEEITKLFKQNFL